MPAEFYRSRAATAAAGQVGGLSARSCALFGALAERHFDFLSLAVAKDRQRHLLPGGVGGRVAGEVFGADHRTAVDGEDDVAAGPVLGCLELKLAGAALQPCLGGGAARG